MSTPRKKMTKQLTGKRDDTKLHSACRAGNIDLMREIFTSCNEEELTELLCKQNSAGETALYVAVEYGCVEFVREIINYYDLVTAGMKARNGFDALHISAKQGDLGMSSITQFSMFQFLIVSNFFCDILDLLTVSVDYF